MKKKKIIPVFKTEKEEAAFWGTHDFVDYVGDTQEATDLFVFSPALVKRIKERAQKRQIALRLERWQIDQAKRIAQKQHIPYQALMRQWIGEGIRRSAQISR